MVSYGIRVENKPYTLYMVHTWVRACVAISALSPRQYSARALIIVEFMT
jgi:hypothetical protein